MTAAEGYGTKLRTWLMSGRRQLHGAVRRAGGMLIALGFAIGGYEINEAPSVMDHFVWTQADSWGALLFQIGGVAFGFLVPVLAGYIAYGMADRPAWYPASSARAISLTVNAGFLGGLAAGLIAGGVVIAIQKVRIPAAHARHHAGGGDPADLRGGRRLPDVRRHRQPIAEAQKGMTDWHERPDRRQRRPARRPPRPDDVLRPRPPGQQGRYTFATAGIAVASPSDSAMRSWPR
ncbi:hypothetical protein GCM10023238_15490 [Streptomyces heliomycini]